MDFSISLKSVLGKTMERTGSTAIAGEISLLIIRSCGSLMCRTFMEPVCLGLLISSTLDHYSSEGELVASVSVVASYQENGNVIRPDAIGLL